VVPAVDGVGAARGGAVTLDVLRLLALALVCAGAYYWSPARLSVIYAAGRASVCPYDRAIGAPQEIVNQIAAKDRILYASKKLETDAQGYERWSTPKGEYWIPKGSHFVLPFNLAEQERDIYTGTDVRVKPGAVVLDCGANIGVFTRLSLERGAAKVIAIEPAPENIECLRRNFRKEIGEGRVVVYPKGVWDKDDFLTLHVDPHNSAADSFLIHREGGHEGEKVPLTTIDKLTIELGLERVDFVKMDIEGAEVKALIGAQGMIAKHHPLMALSAYHNPTDPVEVPKAVKTAWNGYRMQCGPCAEVKEKFSVRPDILYFY
jgi:FkbM family methyltransferase